MTSQDPLTDLDQVTVAIGQHMLKLDQIIRGSNLNFNQKINTAALAQDVVLHQMVAFCSSSPSSWAVKKQVLIDFMQELAEKFFINPISDDSLIKAVTNGKEIGRELTKHDRRYQKVQAALMVNEARPGAPKS